MSLDLPHGQLTQNTNRETRPFVLYLPSSFAPDTEVERKFGGVATNLRFAKN